MSACRACRHHLRDQIDQQIVACTPLRTIAAWSGVSLGALHRHKTHVAGLVRPRTPREREEHGGRLQARAESLLDAAEQIVQAAREKNDLRGAASAITSATRVLELLARMSGQLQPTGGIHLRTTVNNVNSEPDDEMEIAIAIAEATKGFNVNEIERMREIVQGANLLPAPDFSHVQDTDTH